MSQRARTCARRSRRSLRLLLCVLASTYCAPALAQDEDSRARSRLAHNPSLGSGNWDGNADDFTELRAVSALRSAITFGGTFGGIWGGAYTTERNVTGNGALQIVYTDNHAEPVDFSLTAGGLFVAYEYGPSALRLQLTFLTRFDFQSYSAGNEQYESLSGTSVVSARYALLVGPAIALAEGAHGSLDAGLGVGPVLGSYQPLAGAADAVVDVVGEDAVNRPASHALTGVGGRAWLSALLWRPDRKFGIGVGVYFDFEWLHADLPQPWPRIWSDQSFGVMLPMSSRF